MEDVSNGQKQAEILKSRLINHQSRIQLEGLLTIYFLISQAGKANVMFYLLHKPEGESFLFSPGCLTNRAFHTVCRKFFVFWGDDV